MPIHNLQLHFVYHNMGSSLSCGTQPVFFFFLISDIVKNYLIYVMIQTVVLTTQTVFILGFININSSMKIPIHNLQLDVVLTDFCFIRMTCTHEMQGL